MRQTNGAAGHFTWIGAAIAAAVIPVAIAGQGQIVVTLREAHAEKKNDDNCSIPGPWCSPQDFYLNVFPAVAPQQTSPEIDDRDDASWGQGWPATWSVDNTHRFHMLTLQLWDHDTTSSDDPFDINPDSSQNDLAIRFDACFLTWTAPPGVPAPQGPGVVTTTPGNGSPSSDRGHLTLKISTVDGLPFTPNRVIISSLGPVQGAEDSHYVVSSKATSMRLDFASTYTGDVPNVPVTVTVSDGISTWVDGPVPVTIKAGVSSLYFFDGTAGHAPPFRPFKPTNTDIATLTYSASFSHIDVAPPGTPPDLLDCYQANHDINGKTSPIIRTTVPFVLFMPFDYADTFDLPNTGDVSTMAARDELFRKASWPAATSSYASPGIPFLPPYPYPLFFLEPSVTVGTASILADLAHIDKLVLVPKTAWFNTNSGRLPVTPATAIGFSIGEFGPHAVIAEQGHYAVSTHELGHTYKLSQHKCSNGGVAEDWFGVGCRDEYKFPASDGRYFRAEGYDVEGSIFTSPAVDTSVGGCSASHGGARYVCQKNIMDSNSSSGFQNWTDTFTYDLLADKLRPAGDPQLLTLSGYVYSPGWYNATTTPPVFTGALSFSYQTDGVPDVADALPSPGSPNIVTGAGAFSLRVTLNTGAQKIYRFNPSFSGEGSATPPDGAYFAFSVPWDPATQDVELYGPSDILHLKSCEGPPCADSDVLIDRRVRTPLSPVVSNIAAGKDAPPPAGAPAPTIGPGHDAVLTWTATDGDSTDVRAAVMVAQPGPTGGPGQWWPLALDVAGGTYVIHHDQLATAPGDYFARIVASDGINSSELASSVVFHLCNATNGGVERCDGIDNDCDGTVDNALPPPGSTTLTVSRTAISWSVLLAADNYDVVRGDVGVLRSSGGNFAQATQQCVASQTASTSLAYSTSPPSGAAWWFLVRGDNCKAKGTYNEGNNSQTGSRDAGIAASPSSCP